MTPADLLQIGRDNRRIQNGSLRRVKKFLAVFGTDLSGDSLSTMVVKKNDAFQERFINRGAINRETE